jgi:phage-related protein
MAKVLVAMFEVFFYRDAKGCEPVRDYIEELGSRTDKDSRIRVTKINAYIDYLKKVGPRAREPFAKQIDGKLWELRPIRDRILYATFDGRRFILLHHFFKKTRKTPRREIEQAERSLADYMRRCGENEH